MRIESLNLATAAIRLSEQQILIVLVYIEEDNTTILNNIYNHLRKAITKIQQNLKIVIEIIIIEDFNYYNQL